MAFISTQEQGIVPFQKVLEGLLNSKLGEQASLRDDATRQLGINKDYDASIYGTDKSYQANIAATNAGLQREAMSNSAQAAANKLNAEMNAWLNGEDNANKIQIANIQATQPKQQDTFGALLSGPTGTQKFKS